MLILVLLSTTFAQYPFATCTVYPFQKTVYNLPYGEKPIFVDILHRHGSRFPTSGTLQRIKDAYSYINSANVSFWNPWNSVVVDGDLCWRGKEELASLGKFYRNLFEPLFNGVDLSGLDLASTYKPRTQDSLHAFLLGFFSNDPKTQQRIVEKNYTYTIHYQNSTTLLFHKSCKRFSVYSKYPLTFIEKYKYERQQYPYIAELFKKRSNLPSTFQLNVSVIDALSKGSFFEYVVFNQTQKMLSYFSSKDLQKFAYAKDIDTYLTKGYAQPLNYQMAIPLLQTILNELTQAIEEHKHNKQNVVGNFKFAHEETVLPLMTLMGFFSDPYPLKANTDPLDIAWRKWNTSKMGPFATHVVFVVVLDDGKYFVRMYYMQKPVAIPFCNGKTKCPFSEFSVGVNMLSQGFDFEKECAL